MLQATLLCCLLAYHAGHFKDLWLLSGQATRMAIPLGLNHLHAADWTDTVRQTPLAVTSSILVPSQDGAEYHSRLRTFWITFSLDRMTSAATNWSTSIDERKSNFSLV